MDVFQYSDYRTYLADFYSAEKEQRVGFSYRSFARRAGLSSANYLKLVIDGKRPLTEKNMTAFLRGLKLHGPSADYFRVLVQLNEGRDERAKPEILEKMLKLRLKHSGDPLQLNKDRWEILRSWHHWAIREMVLLQDFEPNADWIAKKLGRKITPAQATESLDLLLRLEFLRRAKSGSLEQSEPMITTADDISNLIIRHLHRQFIELGLISLFHDPVEKREMNGLTIALREEEILAFKKALKEFRRELNRQFSAANKTGAEHIYHFETMLFPITKVEKMEKNHAKNS